MAVGEDCLARLTAETAADHAGEGRVRREQRLRFERLSGQAGRRARRLVAAARRRR